MNTRLQFQSLIAIKYQIKNIIINNVKEDNDFEILISEFTFEDEDDDKFNTLKFSKLPNNMEIYTKDLNDNELPLNENQGIIWPILNQF